MYAASARRAVRVSVPRLAPSVVRALHRALFPYLSGMDARDWLRLLRENRFAVDPPYWARAAALTVATVQTTVRRAQEDHTFGRAVAETRVPRPLFVLGNGRSGTTYLQRLLARDPRFGYPNLYQTTHPHTFLSTEARVAPRVAAWLPKTRRHDSVPLSVDAPSEDEFALAIATGCSPALRWVFPRHRRRYARYLTFRAAESDEVARWKTAFVWFLKKLTLKQGRPLVLKSPAHTARIPLLLELFPDAAFVHIHRHPYAVFQSTCRSWSLTQDRGALQKSVAEVVEDAVIERYTQINDAFFVDRARIPRGHVHDVRFEDLERDPIGQIEDIYRALRLPWSQDFETRLRHYLDSIGGYRKNVHPPLGAAVQRRIAAAWRRSFEAWGYAP